MIHRHKKKIALLLIVMLFMTFMPQVAHAAPPECGEGLFGTIRQVLSGASVFCLGYGIVDLITYILTIWVGWMLSIINKVIHLSTGIIPAEIESMWKIVRDFVNMFFIVILIVMAYGTIFNIQRYTYRDLLPKFIISALLINFSYTIGLELLRISAYISDIFLSTMGDVGSTLANGLMLHTYVSATSGDTPALQQFLDYLGGSVSAPYYIMFLAIFFLIINFGAFIVFLSMGLFLIARIPVLWVLLIFAPIAWLGYALPSIRDRTWGVWWKQYIQWTFFPPVYFFFLMFGFIFINGKGNYAITAFEFDSATLENAGRGVAFLLSAVRIPDLLILFLTIFIAIYGLRLSFSVTGAAGKAGEFLTKNVPTPIHWARKIPGFRPVYDRIPFLRKIKGPISYNKVKYGADELYNRFKSEGLPPPVKSWLEERGLSGLIPDLAKGELDRKESKAKISDAAIDAANYDTEFEHLKTLTKNMEAGAQYFKERDEAEEIKYEYDQSTQNTTVIINNDDGTQTTQNAIDFIDWDKFASGDKVERGKFLYMVQAGKIDRKTFWRGTKALENNQFALETVFKDARAKNFKSIGDPNTVDMLGGVAEELAPDDHLDWSHLHANPRAHGALHQIAGWLSEGGGELTTGGNLDLASLHRVGELTGGTDTDDWWAKILPLAKMRPDIVSQYLSNRAIVGDRYKPEDRVNGNPNKKTAVQYVLEKMKLDENIATSASRAWDRNYLWGRRFTDELARQIIEMEHERPSYQQKGGNTRLGRGAQLYTSIENRLTRSGEGKEIKLQNLDEALRAQGVSPAILLAPKYSERIPQSSATNRIISSDDFVRNGYNTVMGTNPAFFARNPGAPFKTPTPVITAGPNATPFNVQQL